MFDSKLVQNDFFYQTGGSIKDDGCGRSEYKGKDLADQAGTYIPF
jgi:hypothetical protein